MEQEMHEQQLSINDYLRILYRGRYTIAVSFFVIMLATVYITFTTPPVYEASAMVLIREDRVQSQVFDMASFAKRDNIINNQVVILKSHTLAQNVINSLYDSDHADSLFILGTKKLRNRFTLMSWLKDQIFEEEDDDEDIEIEKVIENFRENTISVIPQRDTDVIELKAQALSPFEAAFIANTWMREYQALNIAESRGEVREVRDFLESKLTEIESELKSSQENLKDFKETAGVVELPSETQALIQRTAEFESQWQSARTEYDANLRRLEVLKKQLTENEKLFVERAANISSMNIAQLEMQRAVLAGEIASEEYQLQQSGLFDNQRFLNQLQQKKDRLEGLQQKIISEKTRMVESGSAFDALQINNTLVESILELTAENDFLKEKRNALGKLVNQYEQELNRLPAKSLQLANLEREAMVNHNVYIMMRTKYEENRIAEAGQIGTVRIIDNAKMPDSPIKPKKKMNLLLGILLGLGLGVGLTFGREYLDTSLKSIEDVENLGFSALGSIPLIAPQVMNRHIKENGNGEISQIQSRLITHFAPKSPISEAYRTLRTNILYSRADEPIQTGIVTSSGPGEGKSTTVSNLAITFAQMGTKTLLIDGDLRRPVLHGIFGVDRGEGLTNVLIGKRKINEVLCDTGLEDLKLITAGTLPPNPSELLASKAMDAFLIEAKQMYEVILFDSPPIIAVTDAAILARKVDGLVLVMKSGQTNKDALLRAQVLLNNVKATLFGVCVNGVNVERMYGSYYYYYHYYYYGDGKHKRGRKKFLNRNAV